MKKYTQVFVCIAAALCLTTACGKDKPASNNTGKPASASPTKEQQTTSNIKVKINDITAFAGEEIDYIGAIESAENMEINRSMIYVDSSGVDSNTPGTYLAFYTFDYLGTTVTNSIKVTILANPNAASEAAAEETTVYDTETTSENQETDTEETSDQETAASEPGVSSNTEISSGLPPENTQPASEAPLSTEPVSAAVEHELPDANITLSNGKVVTVKCTSSRYITETYTDESYFEEDGYTFLTSELKVLFNTGEIQVIETVVTRVQPPAAADTPQ